MRETKNEIRKPIDIKAGKFFRHSFVSYVSDGQIASLIASQSYIPEIGAGSLKQAVEREISWRLCDCFHETGEPMTDKMNEGPLENYEVRCVGEGDSTEVKVSKAGFKDVQHRP